MERSDNDPSKKVFERMRAMITNDKGIVDLKHHIMREVCRMEWEGILDHENREKLVMQISPGPKPEYRCCVYKEREIVRERRPA